MLEKPTFRSTGLPLLIALGALVVLNLGLYNRLAAEPAPVAVTLALPYTADFASTDTTVYGEFGGDWEVRDETWVQIDTNGYDLGSIIPLGVAPDTSYFFETQLRFIGGVHGGGIIFNAQQTTSRQKSHMARFNVDAGQMWLIYGYFDDASAFIGQGSVVVPNVAPGATDPHTLRLEVNQNAFTLLVDGQATIVDAPLQYRGGGVGFITAASQVAFDNVRVDVLTPVTQPAALVQATATAEPAQAATAPIGTSTEVALAADQLLHKDTFEADAQGTSAWIPVSGNWKFEAGAYVQSEPTGFDLSAGYNVALQAPYTMVASFQHRQGTGGGVLVNMPKPNSNVGATMIRYFENGSVLAWGYFSANGEFVGQGNTGVALPDKTTHRLTIGVTASGYTIALDGVIVSENVPFITLNSPQYIGLTSSQSIVAFEQVEVFRTPPTTEANAASPSLTGGINVDAGLGKWEIVDGTVTQSATEATDYFTGTGVSAETFALGVDLLLPTDSTDVGGGVVFHMTGRDDLRGGQMVRFGSGGKEIFWGRFDAKGVFQGQGGAPLTLEAGQPHTLSLVVRQGSFDIQVDGNPVITNVPTQQQGGWIGLVSFRGPVVFSNIRLTLGGQ